MPSWYQHPSTSQSQSSPSPSSSSPLSKASSLTKAFSFTSFPDIIECILLHLEYYDLKRCLRVCKTLKEVLERETFDAKLFRWREGREVAHAVIEETVGQYTIHPFLSAILVTSRRSYRVPQAASDNKIFVAASHVSGLQFVKTELAVWPPTKIIVVTIQINGDEVSKEQGVRLEDIFTKAFGLLSSGLSGYRELRGLELSEFEPSQVFRLLPADDTAKVDIERYPGGEHYRIVCSSWLGKGGIGLRR